MIRQCNILPHHVERILNLDQLITLSQLEYICKTIHKLNPIRARTTFQFGQSKRKPQNILLPKYQSEKKHKSLFYNSITLWNNLENKAQKSPSLNSLRHHYKKNLPKYWSDSNQQINLITTYYCTFDSNSILFTIWTFILFIIILHHTTWHLEKQKIYFLTQEALLHSWNKIRPYNFLLTIIKWIIKFLAVY